ncbi:unnamed protein product, partial [Staurois parvus]
MVTQPLGSASSPAEPSGPAKIERPNWKKEQPLLSPTDTNDGALFLLHTDTNDEALFSPLIPMMGHYSSSPLTPMMGHYSSH